jgi:hypothetical protein
VFLYFIAALGWWVIYVKMRLFPCCAMQNRKKNTFRRVSMVFLPFLLFMSIFMILWKIVGNYLSFVNFLKHGTVFYYLMRFPFRKFSIYLFKRIFFFKFIVASSCLHQRYIIVSVDNFYAIDKEEVNDWIECFVYEQRLSTPLPPFCLT